MLLDAWRNLDFLLIASRKILQEIERVLRYPHLTKKYHLIEEDIHFILGLIEHEAVVIPDPPPIDIIKDDPDDNIILACVLEAEADYIVSGDKHLLNLKRYENVSIVTAHEFLKVIKPV